LSRWRFAKDSRAGEASTTGIDGVGLVMASAVLTLVFYRGGDQPLRRGPLRSYRRAALRGRADHADDTSPLPFYAYPVLVATLGGWIWTLVKADSSMG